MYLTIDVGNSNIDVCQADKDGLLISSFSFSNENLENFKKLLDKLVDIKIIIASSVVPKINDELASIVKEKLGLELIFLNYKMPTRVEFNRQFGAGLGMDFVANANGAGYIYPDKEVIIVAFGTATTVSIIKNNMLNIVAIMPGLRTSIKALFDNTAMIEIGGIAVVKTLGVNNRSPRLIQSGIYLSHLGGIKEIINMAIAEFSLKDFKVIATGGGANLFEDSGIFDKIEKKLAHIGLMDILKFNGLGNFFKTEEK